MLRLTELAGLRLLWPIVQLTSEPVSLLQNSHLACHANLSRLAELDVALVLEQRRLIAEVEAAHDVALVEHVAAPQVHAPVIRLVAGLQMRERVSVGTLIVRRHVEVVVVDRNDVDARHPAERMPPRRIERELILRRMRLLARADLRATIVVARSAVRSNASEPPTSIVSVACQRRLDSIP